MFGISLHLTTCRKSEPAMAGLAAVAWERSKASRVCPRIRIHPSQKPLASLERIVVASSDPGDMVLDPFCGCATTLMVCGSSSGIGRRIEGRRLGDHRYRPLPPLKKASEKPSPMGLNQ